MFHSRFQSGFVVNGCFAADGNRFEKKFFGREGKRGGILLVNLEFLMYFNACEIGRSALAE